MNDTERLALRLRLHRALMRYQAKLLRRIDKPLTIIYDDGSEEDIGPPHAVEIEPPLRVHYKWPGFEARQGKVAKAMRFDGTGQPIPGGGIAYGTADFTWTSGITF